MAVAIRRGAPDRGIVPSTMCDRFRTPADFRDYASASLAAFGSTGSKTKRDNARLKRVLLSAMTFLDLPFGKVALARRIEQSPHLATADQRSTHKDQPDPEVRAARLPSISWVTSSALVESSHSRRCSPRAHRSPPRVTARFGSGIAFSSARLTEGFGPVARRQRPPRSRYVEG